MDRVWIWSKKLLSEACYQNPEKIKKYGWVENQGHDILYF
jgi:hypothetical protein